jgi:hypothetical protein
VFWIFIDQQGFGLRGSLFGVKIFFVLARLTRMTRHEHGGLKTERLVIVIDRLRELDCGFALVQLHIFLGQLSLKLSGFMLQS